MNGTTQRPGEQRRGALAVHVIVAVNEQRPSRAHRGGHEGDGAVHVRQIVRVGERVERGPEEPPGALRGAVAALHQQPGEGLRQTQCFGKAPDVARGRLGDDVPARRRERHCEGISSAL
jgi:hypothetical protein